MEITGQHLLLSEWQTFYPQVDLKCTEKEPAMIEVKEGWLCQRCGGVSQEKLPAGFFIVQTV